VLTCPLDDTNQKIKNNILKSNSVAIHIRRGDYVNHDLHGISLLKYYNNAIDYILKNVKEPEVFFFSDDIAWVKENIKIDCKCFYVTNNPPEKGYLDLELMKYCKHFVIANSSFSWWGAWLSTNPDKIVIAPQTWFSTPSTGDMDIKDLIPPSWIKMS